MYYCICTVCVYMYGPCGVYTNEYMEWGKKKSYLHIYFVIDIHMGMLHFCCEKPHM